MFVVSPYCTVFALMKLNMNESGEEWVVNLPQWGVRRGCSLYSYQKCKRIKEYYSCCYKCFERTSPVHWSPAYLWRLWTPELKVFRSCTREGRVWACLSTPVVPLQVRDWKIKSTHFRRIAPVRTTMNFKCVHLQNPIRPVTEALSVTLRQHCWKSYFQLDCLENNEVTGRDVKWSDSKEFISSMQIHKQLWNGRY